MFEIGIMNPRRARKRRAKKRRSNPAVKLKRNSKGRFLKRASNPRKKHRRKHRRTARAANPHKRRKHRRTARRASNPRRKRRYHRKHRASNPRRSHRRKHRRSNPRFSLGGAQSSAVSLLKEGAVGGAGALLNSVFLGYALPMLPTTMTTGYALDAVRIVSATALALAGKHFGGKYGEQAGKGAIAVAMYLLLRDIVVSMAPTLPLGDYEEISIDSTSDQIGAYMDPAARLGSYLPDGSISRQGAGAYMGAYMGGARDSTNYEGGMEDGFTMNGVDY